MVNINNLDLNLLKALDALLDEKNVTRAADKLALTQPAVSSMLNRLRDRFDDPLFVRASYGMVPTDRALALAEPLKKILSEIEQLIQSPIFNPAELETTFRIAATDNGMHCVGVPFTLALNKIAPKVKIALMSIHGRNVEAMLMNGELDLIIVGEPTVPLNLRSRIIHKENYVCMMRENHPLANQELDIDTFCSANQVLVSYDGGKFTGATDVALEKIGKKRNVVMSITSFLLLPEILKNSDWIAVAPHHLLDKDSGIISKQPPIEVGGYNKLMAWHERTHHDPIQQWFRNFIIETCSPA
ncbi:MULTISPECIES: LysR family transcriptional regulator [Acinetobacter]|uniref:LysR family transcriptional regulator n=1 Tax=Acinetobacter TaxID=469 RepID=UPI000E942EFF|nr:MULTISPECIES: LysR family transcriptional regulator [Acinetobacter calcoaceticus/baumannii complex]HBU88841.1 transcriptional regulator [Acinetobacter sp.]MDC5672610.1 LysR family transcriptional regulator [Acinetobacter baumannii]MDC5684120.1 LysR family transcriptional regulator [Acinetobacter baumannii]MDC5688627.1 LysR family transcriptional regulator [Acinetobacter baumannii]MDC5699809.1 LysR family transcriptional regulator [Acinetobacter baumannii]